MKKRLLRAQFGAVVAMICIALGAIPGNAHAQKDSKIVQDQRLLDDLAKTRQTLLEAQESVSSLKALYAEKEIQTRDLKLKLDKLQDSFKRSQDSVTQLSREKEILATQQTELSLQLKQMETEKFILQQQNQLLVSCTKENDAKTKELVALRGTGAQDKKELLSQLQQYEAKVAALTKQNETLMQKKGDIEVKYASTSQQVADYKDQELGCLGQKEALSVQVRDLQKEVDSLHKELAIAEGKGQELQDTAARVKKLQGLEEELAQLRRNFAITQNELKQSQEENKKLADIASKYDKQSNLTQEIFQVRKKLSDTEKENRQLQEQSGLCAQQESAKKELENLRSALTKSEQQRQQLEQVCSKAKKQGAELEAKFTELNKKLSALQEENKKLQAASLNGVYVKTVKEELQHLRDELSTCQEAKKKLEQQYRLSGKESQDVQTDVLVLREKVSRLETENRKLHDMSAQAKAGETSFKDAALLRSQIEELRAENKRLKETKEQCAPCAETERYGVSDSKEQTDLRNAVSQLTEERDKLKVEVVRLRQQQEDLVEQFTKSKKEPHAQTAQASLAPDAGSSENISKLKDELKSAQELSYQLVREKADCQKREKDLTDKISDLESQKGFSDTDKEQLAKKNKDLETEYAKLSEQVARVMVQLADVEKQKQSFLGKSGEYQQEVLFVQDKLNKSDQLVAALQTEVENLKKENKDLGVQILNEKIQNQQDVALTRAQLEQANALKEGEFVQLNNKFQDYKAQKELEIKGLSDMAEKLKTELRNAQELSFQMVQEKSVLQGQQKVASDRAQDMENKKSLLEQQNTDLEKQNAFLKNQYVAISQDIARVKDEAARLEKAKVPAELEHCSTELAALKKQLSAKDQDYMKKMQEYEEKYKGYGEIDKDKRVLIEDLAKLRNNYDEMQKRLEISEKIRKDLESIKDRYGRLPEENVNLHYNLGVLYAQNQDYQKAIAELLKVIELKPTDAEAYYNLGVIYGEYLNDRKKGTPYLEKFLDLAPNDPEADRIRKYILTWKTFEQESNDK